MEELEKEHENEVEHLQAEMTDLNQRLEIRLRDTVDAYENDLRNLEEEFTTWKTRCSNLEVLLLDERRRREFIEKQLAILKGEAMPLAPRPSDQTVSTLGAIQDVSNTQQAYRSNMVMSTSCGRCLPGSRCQCVEEVFEVGLGADEPSAEQKRPLTPSQYQDEPAKRRKQTVTEEIPNHLETDFTNFQETPLRPPNPAEPEFLLDGPIESCGFCQDGSTCLCAQLAADQTRSLNIPLGPIPAIKSEEDMLSPGNTISAKPMDSICANGPGTCDKCRSDPTTTLLCKTLNASQQISVEDSRATTRSFAPCPLGSACCRVSKTLDLLPQNQRQGDIMGSGGIPPYPTQAITGPTISCADAFDTLSRHPAFGRASKDLGEWLPRLKTIPAYGSRATNGNEDIATSSSTDHNLNATKATLHPSAAGRTAFEIEAASVMGVLRIFDRRFGKNGA